MTVREARQKHAEAEEILEDLRAARKFAEDQQQRSLESDLNWARSRVKDRVVDVVRGDPSIRLLCEKFVELKAQFIDMRLKLDYLRLKGVLPPRAQREAFQRLESERESKDFVHPLALCSLLATVVSPHGRLPPGDQIPHLFWLWCGYERGPTTIARLSRPHPRSSNKTWTHTRRRERGRKATH